MIEVLGEGNLAALIGLVGGIFLGLAARLGRFCTLGAIEDWLYARSDLRLRMWGVAIGVAIIGSFGLMAAGGLDAAQTSYLRFSFSPAASIAGGLVFGYGMAIAGNCGYGALARLGGGDLRNFVIVLVMGLAAAATLGGPLAYLRTLAFPTRLNDGRPDGIAQDLGALTGLPVNALGIALGVVVLAVALSSARMRAEPKLIFWGAVVGLVVVSGWAGTQWIAANGFDGLPVVSHTFAAPVADAMFWGMTSSATQLGFGVGSVAGVWCGAFIGSLIRGHFRWEACEDPRELRRQIIGAALMGVGAVVAFGCSVGQGISAFSVLAWSAPLTLAAILAGAAFGLRQLIAGFAPAE